jgi:uncharacterized damage-inducible protein DinB
MASADVLVEAFERVREVVHHTVDGLSPEQLATRVDGTSNSIAWLVWHLTRIQDDHISDLAGREQVWTGSGWFERFGLPLPAPDTGYGHDDEAVEAVRAPADLLRGYFDAVDMATRAFVSDLEPRDLDRIVDENWDPPVTLGVRLVSVIADDLQHAGQAAYLRGLVGPDA